MKNRYTFLSSFGSHLRSTALKLVLAVCAILISGTVALAQTSTFDVYAFRGGSNTTFWRYDAVGDQWVTTASVTGGTLASAPNALEQGGSLVTVGNQIYALRGTSQTTFWRYDIVTNAWSTLAAVPGAVNVGGALVHLDGRIYALRGNSTTNFYSYDIASDTWSSMTSTPAAVTNGGALTTDGTYIYAFQGGSTTFWRYDPVANSWSAMTAAPAAVGAGGALVRMGGVIYAFRGGNNNAFWRYNIASNTWTTLTNTPANVNQGGALTIQGSDVYGLRGANATAFWKYNPTLNSWSTLASTPASVNWGGSLATWDYPSADLSMTKTAFSPAGTSFLPGEAVTYTLQATNNGPEASFNVSVFDQLPSTLTYVSHSGGTYNSATGEWTIGNMAIGQTVVLTVNAQVGAASVSAGLTITNEATISGFTVDSDPSNNNDAVSIQVRGADLAVTKSASSPSNPIEEGSSLTYTITVVNNGPETANSVQIYDLLPINLLFVSASATQGTYTLGNSIWDVGTLANGASATLTINTTIAIGGSIRNTAYVNSSSEGDANTANNSATSSVSSLQTFAAGACIIDMSSTASYNAGLKPYGLVFDLVKNQQIPVYWAIRTDKTFVSSTSKTDQVDFTVNGFSYSSGAFIIPAEYATVPAIQTLINTWVSNNAGLTVRCNQPQFQAPVHAVLTSMPRVALDLQNGDKAVDAFFAANRSGVANFYVANSPSTSPYYIKGPLSLNSCDDVYIMPHADPHLWNAATKTAFNTFIEGGGWLYAACHAVSALEGFYSYQGDDGLYMLSNAGLVPWGDHNNTPTPPYSYRVGSGQYYSNLASDPFMQYMGTTDGALNNGSERIYVPRPAGWRSSTTVAVWDPDHVQAPGAYPDGAVGIVAYGRAFGDQSKGMILYQASHTFAGGTVAQNIGAARLLGNWWFQAGVEYRPEIQRLINVGTTFYSGNTVNFSVSVTPRAGSTIQSITWTSSCGGTFSNTSSLNPVLTLPVVQTPTTCFVRINVVDNCGRSNFEVFPITILPQADIAVDKSVNNTTPLVNEQVIFTVAVTNLGPSNATGISVQDVVPNGYGAITNISNGGVLSGSTITWTGLSLASGASVNLTFRANALAPALGIDYLNYAAVTASDQFDPNTANNEDTQATTPVSVIDAVNDNLGSFNGFVGSSNAGNALTNDLLNGSAAPLALITVSVVTPATPAFSGAPVPTLNTATGVVSVPAGTPAGIYTITYRICENFIPTNCDDAVITVTVTAPSIAANDDSGSASGFTGGTAVSNVWSNDQLNGSAVSSSAITTTVVTPASHPGVVLNTATGAVTVSAGTPAAVYTITYRICEIINPTNCDDAVITVTVNSATILANDDSQGPVNGVTGQVGVLNVFTNDQLNGSPVVPAQVTLSLVTPDPTGALTLNPDGSVDVAPSTIAGTYTLVYRICEVLNPTNCDDATVTVFILNNPPTAVNDINMTLMNVPVSGNVLTNDFDTDGDVLTANPVLVSSPTNGSAVLNPNGTYTYTPNTGFIGVDSFVYSMCDNGVPVLCDQATVTITVLEPTSNNEPPVANPDAYVTLVNVPATGNILTNDSDPDGDNIILNTVPLIPPTNGTVTISPTGNIVYTPNTGFTGTDSFVYEICDNGTPVLCAQATVTIQVNPDYTGPSNDPPFAGDDASITYVNTPVSGNHLLNDFDPNGNNIIISTTPVTPPAHGTVVIQPNGTYTYTPNNGYVGTDQFVYRICDDGTPSLCATATTYLVVQPKTISATASEVCYKDVPYMTYAVTSTNFAVTAPVTIKWLNMSNTVIATYTNQAVSGTVLWPGAVVDANDNGLDWPGWIYANGAWTQGSDGFESLIPTAKVVFSVNPTDTVLVSYPPSAPLCAPRPPYGPVAVDDINNTLVNIPVSGNVVTNDFHPQGRPFTVNGTLVSSPSAGTVVVNANGTYTYTPNTGFIGEDSFIYRICDNNTPTLCDNAKVTITVINPLLGNDPPVANPDFYVTLVNVPVNGNVLNNDSDPDSDNLIINTSPLSAPVNGSVNISPSGSFVYTPNNGFVGTDTFVYGICDDGTPSLCDQTLVTILVQEDIITVSNDPPYAGDDAAYTQKNVPVQGNVLLNDYDPNGDPISLNTTPISGPAHGSVVVLPNGNYTYTPNSNYVGPDQFVYEICDNGTPALCARATVYLIVYPFNNPPVAVNDINNTLKNTPVSGNVITNDFDPDGDLIVVTSTPVILPTNGTVVLNSNGTYTYTPNNGFVGEDTFTYELCDNGFPLQCTSAQVTITVLDPTLNNDPPVANPDFYVTLVNVPVNGNVLNNDSDPDGDNLIINTTPVAPPSNGTVSILLNGNIIYTPNPGFVGTDSFVYSICDDGVPSLCDQARVTILVREDIITLTNDPPFAGDDAAYTPKNTPVSGNVLLNDYDPNGDPITLNTTPVSGPSHGTVTILPNGNYTYTPANNYVGPDQFVYRICDNGSPALCAQATVYLIVYPVNNPPVAVDDINNTLINTPVSGNVVTNDFDPDGDVITVNTTPVSGPSNGTLTLNPNGTYTYTPNTGFTGTDSFVYRICDNGYISICDEATVTIDVTPITLANDPPVANPDFYVTLVNVPVPGNLLNNDSDPDGNSITMDIVLVAFPSNGTVAPNPNGNIVYTPNPGFTGTDTFVYRICDDGTPVLCDQATVTVVVLPDYNGPSNDPPFAGDDFAFTPRNVPVSGNLLLNDFDPNGDNIIITVTPVSGPSHGTVSINPDGTYTYTPSLNYTGPDNFVYRICDTGTPSLCAFATAYITVRENNNPPVAVDDINNTLINTPVTGNVLTNDYDPDGNALTVSTTPVTVPTNGTVTISSTGSYTYTPNTGFTGTDSFVYRVCDNGIPQLCDEATVTITVVNVTTSNDPPVANPDFYVTLLNVPVPGNITDNDADPDGNNIILNTTPVTPPANGTVVISPNGNIVYTPNTGFVGTDVFTYSICDDGVPSLCSQTTVTILVRNDYNGPDNDPPYAGDDAALTPVNVPVSGNLLLNDFDPNGNNIIITTTPVVQPAHGTVVILPNGNFTYTPSTDYIGPDQFVYRICDDGVPSLCAFATAYITVYPGPSLSWVVTQPLCFGQSTGSINLTVTNATPPLSFIWSNGAITEDISNIPAGTYGVIVQDALGSVVQASIVVAQPAALVVSVTVQDETIINACNGAATANPIGGTAPYTYLWDDPAGQTTQTATGLCVGIIQVNVTDANGCAVTTSNVINPPSCDLDVVASGTAVSCNGGSNGTLLATPITAQNNAPFTYLWSNGATTQTQSGRPAGPYSVTVTDAIGCQASSSFVITQPLALSLTTSVVDEQTFGGCNGSATVNPSGGTAPYQYLWSNGQTTQTAINLCPNTYTVTVIDARGCTAQRTVTVNSLTCSGFSVSINDTDLSCFQSGNGSAAAVVTGGTAPFTFLWNTGATTQAIANLSAGTYSVTVTDNVNCVQTVDAVVTQPALLQAATAVDNVTCFGFNNGAIELTVTGGTTPYSFAWSNGSTSEDLTGLGPNTYNVVVTDANGCLVNATGTVTEPAALAASSINTNVTCFGGSDGAINLTVTGGLPPYLYSWGGGITTEDRTGLTVGAYAVTIVDQNGCVLNYNTSITQSPAFTPTITAGGPTTFCQGGSVVLTATAGASYLWSNGATTQSITVTATGTFNVTVTTAQGCSGTSASVSVLVNPNPTPTATAIGPTTFCQGGSVQLTTGSFSSYLWSTGATTQSITVSTAGSYTVTVTNANGCVGTSAPLNVTVNPNPTPTITAGGPTTFCQGGSVVLTASAASSYLWSTGATTQSITVTTAGSYTVTVTNANGCSGTSAPTVVTISPLPTPTVSANGPTAFCQGGSVLLTASAASSYLWSTGQTSQSISVSTAGSYTVTVTDANGCQATSAPVNVTVNPNPAPTITPNGPTTFCQGGTVLLTASSATSYLWNTGATTQSITVSTSGIFSVTVTNANGCNGTSAPIQVTVNTPPVSTITPIGPTTFCQGGSVQLIASGGVSYSWSNGATTQAITVSTSGSYRVTVTDANGCSSLSAPVVVTVNPLPDATITAGGPTNICSGSTVTLTASAGTSFLWNTGATSQSIVVSTAGNYTVTVTNANGCSRTSAPTTVTVNTPTPPSITASGPTTFCAGGSVTLTSSLASSYLWSNGATTRAITVSAAGSYSVTVTDENGCVTTSAPVNVVVNSNPVPTITAGGPTALCQGQSVTLTASVASSYLWSTGATTQSITVSTAGSYTVTVTDANGCTGTSAPRTVTVNPRPTPTVTANGPTTFCQGGNVVLTASAATSYLWSTGAVSQSITVSVSGSYTVTVTDANGCTGTSDPVVVNVNPLPTPTVSANGPTTFCQGGSVTLTSSPAASYLWSTGATTQSITVSASNVYSVTVTDVNGCSNTSANVTVTVLPNPVPTITAGGPTTFCQGGSVTLTASVGASYLWSTGATTQSITVSQSGSYSVTVTDVNGCSGTSVPTTVTVNTLPTPTAIASGPTTFCVGGNVTLTASTGVSWLWNTGAVTQSIVVSATGNYWVTVTDLNGCSATSAPVSVNVNSNPTPTITAGGPTTFCQGGSVVLTSSLATSYLWSTGATTRSITVSAAGSYSVTVTDGNGCSATSASVPVSINPLPTPTVSANGPTTLCQGESVQLTSSVAASYLWSTGATTQSITVSTAGSYSVTVTDANGCVGASTPVTVTVNSLPTPTITPNGPTTFCVGGSVQLTASAGASYLWNTGATTQTITVTTSGVYAVTVSDINGCSADATPVVVTVNPLPIPLVTIDGPTTFCQGGSVTLTSRPATAYEWSNAATTQSITVTTSGTYTVMVTNANGCQAISAPVTVTVNPTPTPTINASGPTTFCQGGSVVLAIVAPGTVVWSNGDVSALTTVTTSGHYWATYTDANGCTGNSDTINVVVNPRPTPLIITDGTPSFCVGDPVNLITGPYASYLWSNGAVTQGISTMVSGTFTVTVTDGNGCVGVSPPVVVDINANPTPTISPDGILQICDGQSVTLTSAPAVTYLWSTGETTQSIVVNSAGIYNVFATDPNGCSAISADVTVIVNPNPTPTILTSGPTTFCTGGDVVLSTQAYSSYVWSVGSVAPSIVVSNSGTFTVTVTDANGCVGTSPSVDVVRFPVPPVNISTSGPPTICSGDSVQLTATLAASYLWNTGATTQSIWVSTSGSYTVTITDINGCPVTSAPINVTVLPLPTPTVFPFGPQQICFGSTVTLTSTTAASYLWSTGETTQSIVVGTGGIYTLNVQDINGCTSATVNIPVTVNPLPTPVIVPNGPTEFCDGGSVLLSTTLPYSQYVWSTGTVASNVLVSNSGTFTVTVSDVNGCQGTSAPISITEYPVVPATISVSGPTTICDADSVQLTASAGVSYLWSTGATTQSIWVSVAGAYNVQVTDVNGCVETSAPVNVTVLTRPTPTVFPFGPQQICAGGSVTLTATSSTSYLWSTGETTQSIVVTQGGLYTVTVTDANGCTGSVNDIPVTVNPLPQPVIVANGPTDFCDGGSVVLSTTVPFNGYVWSTGTVSPTITVNSSGTFSVTVTDANGCQGTSAAVTITEFDVPPVSVTTSGPPTICQGDSVQLTASLASAYLWSNGATTQSIWVNTSGTYTVTITDALGCSATSAPVNVTTLTLPTPTLFPFGPQFICQGQAITLTSTTASSYLWNTGATTQSIVVTQAGTYNVTVTDANGCQAVTGDVVVTVNPLPVPTVVANGALQFCQGGNVQLATQNFAGYQWSSGAAQQTTIVTQPGDYWVTVIDNNGCVGVSDPVTVTVNPPPTVTVTPSGPTEFCEGGSVTLTASPGQSYSWSTGQVGQSITVFTSATYFVTVTDANGCVGQSVPVTISVYPLPNPNITALGPTEFCNTDSVLLRSSPAANYLWSNGATTQNIWVNQPGNYFVTLTNSFGCSATSSSINVTVNNGPTPFIVAGGPTTFCNGGTVALSASGAQSYLWSTGSTLPTITVASSGVYTVTGFDANGCSGVSVPVTVTEYDVPTVTVTADGPTTFCAGGSVTLSASPADSYLWSTGATTQDIVVSAAGTYTVSVTDANGCPGSSTGVTVLVNPLPTPVITANGPLAFCFGDSVTLSVSGYQGYQWSTGATTSSITVYDAGQFFVTVVDGNGCAGTSAMVSTSINPDPVVTITSNTGTLDVCQGANLVLTASAASSYLWSTGSVSQSIQVTQGGTYSVSVTNQFGCEGSASVDVVIRPLPTPFPVIAADGPTTFCDGDSVGLSVVSNYAGYLWSTGDTTQNIIVSNSGLYTVTVSNEFGCSSTASGVVVTANPNPTPDILATGDTVFCAGGSVVLATTVFNSYEWSTGETSQFITVTQSGQYAVTVTNSFGCSATSDTTSVTVYDLPTVDVTANGPTTICPGSSVVLTASGTGDILWSNGLTDASITVFLPGTYTVTVTDPVTGCSNTSAPVVVDVYPVFVPNIVPNGPTAFCGTGEVTLTATQGTAYLWSTGDTTQSITVSETGIYGVIVTDANGCQGVAAETVTVLPAPIPVITPSGNPPFCQGETITLTAALNPGGTFLWNTGETGQSIDVTQSGLYSVVITNVFGCTAEAFLPVGFVPSPTVNVTVQGGGVICEGETAQLNASFTLGGTYVWSNGATGQNITVSQSGTYSVTVTNLAGCSATSNQVTVTVQPGSRPEAGPDVTICEGQEAVLTATGSSSYLWSPGGQTSSSITVSPQVSTMYVVTSTGQGCGQGLTDTVWVFVSPQPVAAFTNTQSNLGSVVNFTDQSTPQSAITSWQWNFGDGIGSSEVQNPQYTYTEEEGVYTVTLVVSTSAGCADTVSVDLEVKEFFIITDVLTPNNDGVNDYIWITSTSAQVINATIYSRWGESVWVGTGKDLRFYGRSNAGAELSAGTYYYVIQVDYGDGVVNDYTGYITLIR